MSRLRWLAVLRISPYAFFFVALIALIISALTHCSNCEVPFAAIFMIGALWLVAARVISYFMMADIAQRVARGEIPNPFRPGIPLASRPVEETHIRGALRALDKAPGGSPTWLHPAVETWLGAAPGPQKERLRAALLQRLYDEAAQPGDQAQRHALNEVRQAINPWDDTA